MFNYQEIPQKVSYDLLIEEHDLLIEELRKRKQKSADSTTQRDYINTLWHDLLMLDAVLKQQQPKGN